MFNNQIYSLHYRYLTTFKYIHLRAQEEADRRGVIDKEFVWPLSFPDCTPQLREFSSKPVPAMSNRMFVFRRRCPSMDSTSLFSYQTCQMSYHHWTNRHWKDIVCIIITGSRQLFQRSMEFRSME